jgi:hypothetical protein
MIGCKSYFLKTKLIITETNFKQALYYVHTVTLNLLMCYMKRVIFIATSID